LGFIFLTINKMASFQPGARPVLFVGQDGLARPSGVAMLPNGQTCPCNTPSNWVAKPASQYNPKTFAVMLSPEAQADLQSQGGQVNSTFSRVNMPGRGPVGISRLTGNASPSSGNKIFTLVLNNTAGATQARQFLGDYFGTYALSGNTEATPAGFLVGGTFGTNSKTQFGGRTLGRPWEVGQIQFVASDENFFNLTNAYYIDTPPNGDSPTKDSLALTSLLNGSNFNNKIQFFTEKIKFDGINGLDITIPAGMSVTLQFGIMSEGSATEQVLLT